MGKTRRTIAAEPPVAPSETEQEEGLEQHHFVIRHDLQKRLDIYLRDRMPHHSRSMLQKLIKGGLVFVNSRAAKASTILRSGDAVDIAAPRVVEHKAEAEKIPLNIIYEDDDFIAINKQADLLVHPARGHWTGTLINGLIHHAQETAGTLSTGSDPWRPGIIHRLDRNTTGLILIAKTDEAHWRLAGQFERRTIRKTYLAIVHGTPPLDSDLIDAPLGVDPHNREKYAVLADGGRASQTVYKVLERLGDFSLLELAPKTGRTHQLRVHLSHVGLPIAGDTMYGGRIVTGKRPVAHGISQKAISGKTPAEDAPIISRQALHAWKLQFVHPTKFTRMTLEAPLPRDMADLLRVLNSRSR